MSAQPTTNPTAEHPPLTAYLLYESRKAAWANEHPQATAAEYEQAVMHIAQETGI